MIFQQRRIYLLQIAIAALFLAAIDLPLFIGEIYHAHDLSTHYLPIKWFYQRSLELNTEYLWFPYWLNGMYIHGEGQAGLFHPINYISYGTLPFYIAFNFEVLRGYVLLLVGTYLFLRRWSLSRESALFGAMSATFAGASLFHYFMLNVLIGVAHLPWLLLCIDVVVRDRRPDRVAIASISLALLTGSQILLAHPQSIWMSGLTEALYVVLLLTAKPRIAPLTRLAFAKLIGLGLGAIQVLPMLDVLADSHRAEVRPGFGEWGAIHPLDIVQFFAPYLIARGGIGTVAPGLPILRGDLGYYAGATVPVLLVWLIASGRIGKAHKRLAVGALILATITLLLAMGDAGGLYSIQRMIPLANLFRTPARYGMIVHFSLALIMAIAFEALLKSKHEALSRMKKYDWAVFLVPLIGLLGIAFYIWTSDYFNLPRFTRPALLAVGPMLLFVAALLVFAAARGKTIALFLLLAFCAADQAFYGLSFPYGHGSTSLEAIRSSFKFPPGYHRDARALALPSIMAIEEVRITLGTVALVPIHLRRLARATTPIENQNTAQFMRLSSIQWRNAGDDGSNLDPLPRVRMVTESRPSADPLSELHITDIDHVALVPERLQLEPGPAGQATLLAEEPGRLRIHTSASSRQLLIVSESYHEGWAARYEDGRECAVIPVYGHFLGCVVEQGRHQITFHFMPRSFVLGRNITLVGCLVVVVWAGVEIVLGRRRRRVLADSKG